MKTSGGSGNIPQMALFLCSLNNVAFLLSNHTVIIYMSDYDICITYFISYLPHNHSIPDNKSIISLKSLATLGVVVVCEDLIRALMELRTL